MNILTRYFIVIGVMIFMFIIIRHLLTRQQQRTVHQFVSWFAKILLLLSLLAALLVYLQRF